jgi:16S rRNA U1498 N3-methylase RsmE
MKIIWYHFSSKCSDNWDDEASREYINRPVHIIREADEQCMSCHKSQEDAEKWLEEYSERMKPDFTLQNMR